MLTMWLLEVNTVRLFLVGLIIFILVIPVSAQELPEGIFLSARKIDYSMDESSLSATGASLSFSGITIRSDTLQFFFESGDVYATGNVSITKDGETLRGNSLYFNTKSGKGTLDDVSMQFGAINLNAVSLEVTGDELVLKTTRLTTCRGDKAHYYLKARSIKLFPGEKIIADSVTLYLEGVPVFYLPRYQVSLKERGSFPLPEVGYNKDAGFYANVGFRFPLKQDASAGLKLNFAQKAGVSADFDIVKSFSGATVRADFSTRGTRSALLNVRQNGWNFNAGFDITPSVVRMPHLSLGFQGLTVGAVKIIEPNASGWKGYSNLELERHARFGNTNAFIMLSALTSIYETKDVVSATSFAVGLDSQITQSLQAGVAYRTRSTYGVSPFNSDRISDFKEISGFVKIKLTPENSVRINLSSFTDPSYSFIRTTDCYEASIEWVAKQRIDFKIRLLDL